MCLGRLKFELSHCHPAPSTAASAALFLLPRLARTGFELWAMNFGAKSKDLLVELKRSDWLPPYNEDGVRGVLAEIQALYDELTDTLGGRTTVSSSVCLRSLGPSTTSIIDLATCVWSPLHQQIQLTHSPSPLALSAIRVIYQIPSRSA